MGKLGRFACIFAPMVLTIASMLCLVLIFTAQLNSKNEIQRSLYFFKAETKDFIADPNKKFPDVPNTEIDNKLLKALQGAATKKDLKDFYQVGLWNYCEGDVDDKGKETITYCSPRKANFWFDPAEHWGLNNVTAEEIYTKEMKDGIDAYHKVAKWIFTAYVITIILTGAEFIIGIFAIFSRWGSLATTIVSTAQTVFCIAAAGSATGVYAALVGVFHTVLDPYNINSYLGKKMLAVVWLAVAFSIASGFFWLISICCCSGKSPHKKVVVEKTPYTYERVASPYMGAAASSHGHAPAPVAGHGTSGSAYEPYRHS